MGVGRERSQREREEGAESAERTADYQRALFRNAMIVMSEQNHEQSSIISYFVDEASDPTLFAKRGRIVIGSEGVSRFFILGKVDIEDPPAVGQQLEGLRRKILADPYFKDVPSMQPERRKTALAFHATEDLPEVRREVFQFLSSQSIRFYAVVRDKRALLSYVQQENERNPGYRYNPNELYHVLVQELFAPLRSMADRVNICYATRGSRSRTQAFQRALDEANAKFKESFGFERKAIVSVTPSTPGQTPCLQIVDYYLWALQRFYEKGEDRFIELVWPQVGDIHDLDFRQEGRLGCYFGKNRPLNR